MMNGFFSYDAKYFVMQFYSTPSFIETKGLNNVSSIAVLLIIISR